VNDWRNDKWSATFESLDPEDQLLWRMTKHVMRASTPSHSLFTQGGITFLDAGKAESLSESLEVQCQLVTVSLVLAFTEMFDLALGSYFPTLTSESKPTNPDEVHEAIWSLKVGRAPDPNGFTNRALKHLSQ
jgi:hypothetical protein